MRAEERPRRHGRLSLHEGGTLANGVRALGTWSGRIDGTLSVEGPWLTLWTPRYGKPYDWDADPYSGLSTSR